MKISSAPLCRFNVSLNLSVGVMKIIRYMCPERQSKSVFLSLSPSLILGPSHPDKYNMHTAVSFYLSLARGQFMWKTRLAKDKETLHREAPEREREKQSSGLNEK